MLIKSLIKRDGGSVVNIGSIDYHFLPDTDGDHVCEVAEEDNAALFLAIAEGYAQKGAVKPTKAGKSA
jgi:hypothetical protein